MDTSTNDQPPPPPPIAAQPIGRSNTVFGSLKWWPSSSNSANRSSSDSSSTSSSSTGNSTAAATSSSSANLSSASTVSLPGSAASSASLHCGSLKQLQQQHQQHFGSGGHGSSSSSGILPPAQKLRESKWFTVDESRVLCAVVEPGFVVEIREGQENESAYGVVQFKACKDKKPKPQDVDVYTIKATSAQTAATSGRLLRVVRRTLADLWQRGCTVRIQNFGDREHRPHSEKDIRNQIAFAQKAKQMLWQSSQHFAFWCRYGERQQDIRRKQVDSMRFKLPLGIVY